MIQILSILYRIVGLIYTYFFIWLISSFVKRDWFYKTETQKVENKINIIFQFTTRGGNPEVVNRGIENILLSKLESYVIFVF